MVNKIEQETDPNYVATKVAANFTGCSGAKIMHQRSTACMDIDVNSVPVPNKSLNYLGIFYFSKCVVTVTNLLRKDWWNCYNIPLLCGWSVLPLQSLVSSVFVYQDLNLTQVWNQKQCCDIP